MAGSRRNGLALLNIHPEVPLLLGKIVDECNNYQSVRV